MAMTMAKAETTKLVKDANADAPVSYKTTPPKGKTKVEPNLREKLFKVVTKLGKQKKNYPGHLKHPLPAHYDTSKDLCTYHNEPKGKASMKDHGMEIHQQEQLAKSKKAMRAKALVRKGMMDDDGDGGMVY